MPMQLVRGDTIISQDVLATSYSYDIDMTEIDHIAIQAVYTNATPSADTFLAGEAETGTITFDTKANTTAGDYVVIVDGSGLSWAIAADKTGSDPAPSGAIYTAIPSARKAQADISGDTSAADVADAFVTAFNALTGFTAAVTLTDNLDGTVTYAMAVRGPCTDAAPHSEDDAGAGSIVVAVTNQGVASEVDAESNRITLTAHAFVTGLKVAATSGGTLPAGLSATNYWVIVVDSNTIQLATSLANALAGTAVDITGQGTDGVTHTLTPASLGSVVVKLQESVDGTNFQDISGKTVTISAAGTTLWKETAPCSKYIRVLHTPSAGAINLDVTVFAKASV